MKRLIASETEFKSIWKGNSAYIFFNYGNIMAILIPFTLQSNGNFDNYFFFTFWLFSSGVCIGNDLPPVDPNAIYMRTIS